MDIFKKPALVFLISFLITFIVISFVEILTDKIKSDIKLNEVKTEYYQKILKREERPWTTH